MNYYFLGLVGLKINAFSRVGIVVHRCGEFILFLLSWSIALTRRSCSSSASRIAVATLAFRKTFSCIMDLFISAVRRVLSPSISRIAVSWRTRRRWSYTVKEGMEFVAYDDTSLDSRRTIAPLLVAAENPMKSFL